MKHPDRISPEDFALTYTAKRVQYQCIGDDCRHGHSPRCQDINEDRWNEVYLPALDRAHERERWLEGLK